MAGIVGAEHTIHYIYHAPLVEISTASPLERAAPESSRLEDNKDARLPTLVYAGNKEI